MLKQWNVGNILTTGAALEGVGGTDPEYQGYEWPGRTLQTNMDSVISSHCLAVDTESDKEGLQG